MCLELYTCYCVGVPDADPPDVAAKERFGCRGGGRGRQTARQLLYHLLAAAGLRGVGEGVAQVLGVWGSGILRQHE